MRDRDDFLGLENVATLAGDDLAAAMEDVVRVAKEEAKETGVKNGLKKRENGELGELHFGFPTDV